MDRSQEVLALINNVKNQFTVLTEKQREINHDIEGTLNRSKENTVQVLCEDYLERLKRIDAKQMKLDQLLESKQVVIESNSDIKKILERAEITLNKLLEYTANKKERNIERSMIIDIMVCYWNAVGIRLQFGKDSNTTLLLTNHDQENELFKNCKIDLKITDEGFEIIDVEPKSRSEEMKQIESDVKSNGKGLTILIFRLYSHFVNSKFEQQLPNSSEQENLNEQKKSS